MTSAKRMKPKDKTETGSEAVDQPTRVAMRKSESGLEVSALKVKLDQATTEKVKKLTDNHRLALFFSKPKDMQRAIEDLKHDLCDVPVIGEDGVTDPFGKIESYSNISRADKDLIWACLAVVR